MGDDLHTPHITVIKLKAVDTGRTKYWQLTTPHDNSRQQFLNAL